MAEQRPNGVLRLLPYLIPLVAVGVSYGALQTQVTGQALEIERQQAKTEKVPVIEERVKAVQRSIMEIKQDVKSVQTTQQEILRAIYSTRRLRGDS